MNELSGKRTDATCSVDRFLLLHVKVEPRLNHSRCAVSCDVHTRAHEKHTSLGLLIPMRYAGVELLVSAGFRTCILTLLTAC